jgi:flagellar P-ring protein precursor FlgI
VSLKELVLALNSLGITPRDLIAVFEALKEAGALQAELVIM